MMNITDMYVVLLIFGSFCAIVLAFFKFLELRTAKTYKPSPDEVAEKLRRVLAGTMPWQEWDEFVCVPIRNDDELNSIHLRCAEIQTEEFMWRENGEEREKWNYNDKGLLVIRALLTTLQERIEREREQSS